MSLHVLVAEDDPDLLALAVQFLAQPGYVVQGAADGSEALERGHGMAQLDVLFTDVVMPGCSGIELAATLAAERPVLRAVFTSSFAADEVRTAIADLGCELLEKPYSRAAARRSVAEARTVGSGRSGREVAS